MKRLAIVLVLSALSASLGGCLTLSEIETGISLTTKSITNPVTPDDEAKVELILDTAVKLLKVYKTACISGTADTHCKGNIAQLQPYTRQVKPLVAQMRTFVDSNDQVNASVIYNQLKSLYTTVKSVSSQLGVNLGSDTI